MHEIIQDVSAEQERQRKNALARQAERERQEKASAEAACTSTATARSCVATTSIGSVAAGTSGSSSAASVRCVTRVLAGGDKRGTGLLLGYRVSPAGLTVAEETPRRFSRTSHPALRARAGPTRRVSPARVVRAALGQMDRGRRPSLPLGLRVSIGWGSSIAPGCGAGAGCTCASHAATIHGTSRRTIRCTLEGRGEREATEDSAGALKATVCTHGRRGGGCGR